MQLVRSGFGDDVNRRSARSAELRRVVAAVDLKLLNSILAQREPHSASVIIGFSAVNGDAIASAIAAIEGKAALRCLISLENPGRKPISSNSRRPESIA